MTTLKEYQEFTASTAVYPKEKALEYCCLGLAGEAGEVCDKVKKILRGDAPLSDEKKREIAKELSDVLWYASEISKTIGYTLEEILDINIQKLSSRKERGVLKGDGDNR